MKLNKVKAQQKLKELKKGRLPNLRSHNIALPDCQWDQITLEAMVDGCSASQKVREIIDAHFLYRKTCFPRTPSL